MKNKIIVLLALLLLILVGNCGNFVYENPESEPIQKPESKAIGSSVPVRITNISYGHTASDIGNNNQWDGVWIINSSYPTPYGGKIYKRNIYTQWVFASGAAEQISLGGDALPWCVNGQGLIYECVQGLGWVHRPGTNKMGAVDIGVGTGGAVYIISNIRFSWIGYEIYKWTGSRWTIIPGFATRIDVDDYGTPWCVNGEGKVFIWDKQSNNWFQITGTIDPRATDIDAGEFSFIVSNEPTTGGYKIYMFYADTWRPLINDQTGAPVGGVKISSDRNYNYFCRNNGEIFQFDFPHGIP